MPQKRIRRTRRVTDKRRAGREDEPQEEKKEVREDLRHWFEER